MYYNQNSYSGRTYGDRYRSFMRDEYRKAKSAWQDKDWDFAPKGLRRSRSGVLLGVCQGIADWLGMPAWPLRVAAIITFVATGFYPVGLIYLAAAILMIPENR